MTIKSGICYLVYGDAQKCKELGPEIAKQKSKPYH